MYGRRHACANLPKDVFRVVGYVQWDSRRCSRGTALFFSVMETCLFGSLYCMVDLRIFFEVRTKPRGRENNER